MSILEKPIYNMIQNEPFYANFLLNCKISIDHKDVKRAAVGIFNHQITFFINSDWYSSLILPQQIAVLKHELFHLLLEHTGVRSGDKGNKQAKNYAMDCAINQFISNLPDDCVTLESMEKLCNKTLNKMDTWEYYYEQLKNEVENNPDKYDHDMMEGSEGLEWESEQAIDKATIKDEVNKAIKSSAGNIPDELQTIISRLNQPNKINWKQQLRNLISSARHTTSKSTRMKVHRRFELDQPGKKKDRKLVLGVCLDSSGSISNESFESFMNEIISIAKNTTITYLIQADTEVQRVDVIKGGKPKSEILGKRYGNGGTAYTPSINECMRRKCDAIVFFGDFDCADKPENPGIPFIWVGVGDSPPPADFGSVIRI